MNDHPVQLRLTDDLARSRATVFFRLVLAIPHFVWVALWGIVAFFAVIANWFATLFAGRSPDALHDFLAAYVRYVTHVNAYVLLAAEPFPGFTGRPGSYPVDVEIAPPAAQNRWKVGFRIVLAVPASIFAASLFGYGGGRSSGFNYSFGVAATAALLAWFAILARGRMPRGLRDAIAHAIAYSAQLDAYFFLLTDRYPNSDPIGTLGAQELPPHALRLALDDDLQRSRLTVFFRALLAIPHFIWLLLWGIAAGVAVIVNWFATLFTGRSPAALHGFLSAYVRYTIHVYAYMYLIANPFPGFTGRPGSYPVDIEIDPPARQNRWITGFRIVLVIPAFILALGFNGALSAAAVLGWFASLFTGEMPRGLRNMGAVALRYAAQTSAYYYLLTDRYPYGGPTDPVLRGPAAPVPAVAPERPTV